MKWVAFLAVIVALIVAIACESNKEDETSPSNTPADISFEDETSPSNIPADISFSVVDTDIVPNIKRSLDVRLNKKVSEDTLRAIALELRSEDSRTYERTFIVYYLPGMTVGSGGWATTHFDPTLDVRILGITAQEERTLVVQQESSDREVIGIWLDEIAYAGSGITIYRESGTLYMDRKFKDGSVLKEEMVEKPSPLGQRFESKEGSGFGDHWIIDQNGNLQSRDNDGLISTANRIQ